MTTTPSHYTLQGHTDTVTCLSPIDETPTLLSCGEDKNTILWDIRCDQPLTRQWSLEGDRIGTCCIASTSHAVWIGSDAGTLFLYDTRKVSKAVREWSVGEDEINSVAVHSGRNGRIDDEHVVVGDDSGNVHVVSDGGVRNFECHDNVCTSVLWGKSSDMIISGGLDSILRIRPSRSEDVTDAVVIPIDGPVPNGFIYDMDFNDAENVVCAALGSGDIYLLDVTEHTPLTRFMGHAAATISVEFATWNGKESQIVSAGNDNCVILWDVLHRPEEEGIKGMFSNVEQEVYDWERMCMRWKHSEKMNGIATMDVLSSCASVLVCDLANDITVYMIES